MATEYAAAPEVADIVTDLIGKHHTRLADVRIECLFRDKAAKKNGKIVGGTAKKVSGLNAFLAREITSDIDSDPGDAFFIIEVGKDVWDALTHKQRIALVDHEMCHCSFEYDADKGEYVMSIRGHDIEEFAEIVERHGLWEDDLVKFAEAMKSQMDFFDEAPDDPDLDVDPEPYE